LGTVQVLQVEISSPGSLQALIDGGFDIAGVRGGVATVYATPEECERLVATGYSVRQVGLSPDPAKMLGAYHTYAAQTADLRQYAEQYPLICRLVSIGQSVEGREIWALLITDNPDAEEAEPEVRYAGTVHGNEPPGMELCLYFVEHLLSGYGTDARITEIVNSTEIWVLPLLNPDGLERGSRYNANGYDLNRSFPQFPGDFAGTTYTQPMSTAGRQPEVAALMAWCAGKSATLAANFHTGELVVNYPYDDDGKPAGIDSPTPDDPLFEAISLEYASRNAHMYASPDFDNGITNGAAWYVVSGSLQDWTYRFLGGNEVTIELSTDYAPPSYALPALWNENRDSMLALLETAHWGIGGTVRDEMTGQPVHAQITVNGNAHAAYTDPDAGDYHRMLLPGTYTLTFFADGYPAYTVEDVAVQAGRTTTLDVMLPRDSDGDGLSDAEEGDADADWDGKPNYLDTDSDGNGLSDAEEGLADLDDDALENFVDPDNDGDGFSDIVEVYLSRTDPYDASSVPAHAMPAAGVGAAVVAVLAMMAVAEKLLEKA
jgi:hypothetical protein